MHLRFLHPSLQSDKHAIAGKHQLLKPKQNDKNKHTSQTTQNRRLRNLGWHSLNISTSLFTLKTSGAQQFSPKELNPEIQLSDPILFGNAGKIWPRKLTAIGFQRLSQVYRYSLNPSKSKNHHISLMNVFIKKVKFTQIQIKFAFIYIEMAK